MVSWNYYGGSSAKSMKKLGNTRKTGLETIAAQLGHYAFSMTEVVVGNGIALRKSSVIKIFVLRPGLASVCNRDPVPLISKSFSVRLSDP